eukprot:4543630-Amphidinium_carterae.1
MGREAVGAPPGAAVLRRPPRPAAPSDSPLLGAGQASLESGSRHRTGCPIFQRRKYCQYQYRSGHHNSLGTNKRQKPLVG